MNIFIKKSLIKFFVINQFLIGGIFSKDFSFAKEINNKPTSEYFKKEDKFKFYILGPGDAIKIEVSERTFELNNIYIINGAGYLNIKRLNKIFVSGLTLEELTDLLNEEYSIYVKKPDVKISLINYRPVKFYIDGEVENPGIHILPGSINAKIDSNETIYNQNIELESSNLENRSLLYNDREEFSKQIERNYYFPTLIDAIRLSGGVTANADLTKIRIQRINSLSNGSGKLGTYVNLSKAINLEDSSQNIRLFDGDTIYIQYSNTPVISQISNAVKSNLNPKFTDVLVGGNVDKPGKLTLRKSSVLNDAVLISAGSIALKGPITFIRNKNDGTFEERQFKLDTKAKRGTYKNPYLRSGDIIIVNDNVFSSTGKVLDQITSPITGITRGYLFYKLLKD
tara:strand:+ start:1149 stop:2339 length:1191 start_codon:yes stop_codon:yes gene_type:complete